MLGKCRRIHDDKVIRTIRHIFDKVDGIGTIGGVLLRGEAVERHVAVHHIHGPLRAVHRVHVHGAAGKGVDGETARVAKKIEHMSVS